MQLIDCGEFGEGRKSKYSWRGPRPKLGSDEVKRSFWFCPVEPGHKKGHVKWECHVMSGLYS